MSSRFTDGVRIDEERVAKLPTWARKLIEHQQQRLRQAGKAFDEVAGQIGETNVEANPNDHTRFCLREHTTVRFKVGARGYIDVRHADGRVQIMGNTSMVIHPQVSNVIIVEPVR